jgi:hypothetical protein
MTVTSARRQRWVPHHDTDFSKKIALDDCADLDQKPKKLAATWVK